MSSSTVSIPGALLVGDQTSTPSVSVGRGGSIVVDNTVVPARVTFTQLSIAGALPLTSLTAGSVACSSCTASTLTSTSLSTGPVTCSSLSASAGATQSQCSARVFQFTPQTILNNTDTVLQLDTLEVDTSGDPGSVNWPGIVLPTGVFTVPRAGVYHITQKVTYASSATGIRDSWVIISGSSRRWGEDVIPAVPAGSLATRSGSFVSRLGVGATLSVHTLQNSGGSLSTGGGGTRPSNLQVVYLSE